MSEINLYNRIEGKRINLGHLTLFTLPECEKCEKVKRYLEKNNIKYSEVNVGDKSEGKDKFTELYVHSTANESKLIKKDDKGLIIFPVLLYEKVVQGIDNIVGII